MENIKMPVDYTLKHQLTLYHFPPQT